MDETTFLSLLQELSPEQLAEMLTPYQQEQSVLDQQMAMAQQLRERNAQRSSPWGAALSGLGNAVGEVSGAVLQQKGLEGQRALGGRMQTDAVNRLGVLGDARKKALLDDFLQSRGQGLGLPGPLSRGR